jgi:hypothetical protein
VPFARTHGAALETSVASQLPFGPGPRIGDVPRCHGPSRDADQATPIRRLDDTITTGEVGSREQFGLGSGWVNPAWNSR